MKQLFFLLFFITAHSQITFERGYIISDKNQRIECLIKNQDWIKTPKQVEYKLTESSPIETISFSQMNAFQVYNTSQYYEKYNISVDRIIDQQHFDPKQEAIILKVLVEGSASLYTDNNDLFFYKKEDGVVKQLVYKKYVENQFLKENNMYRNELYNNLKCENNLAIIRKLKYNKNNLVSFFKNYNNCQKSEYRIFNDEGTKTKFNLNLTVGANFNKNNYVTNIKTPNPPSAGQGGFTNSTNIIESTKTNVALGFEAEILLPFNKNKWSVFVAPNYQELKYEFQGKFRNMGMLIVDFDYKGLEIPLGVRHYFDINTKNKIFLDAAYNFVFTLNISEDKNFTTPVNIDLLEFSAKDDISSVLRFGVGYKYDSKYSISLNYLTEKRLMYSNVGGFSLIATYKLF